MGKGLFALFSSTEGPDGNGLLNLFDTQLGGLQGTGTTAAGATAPMLLSGGFVPADQVSTTIEATVQLKTPTTGLPTASGSMKLKGQFVRNGNNVSQVGDGVTLAAEIATALRIVSAKLFVDTSQTPNQITVQVTPPGASGPAIAWQWSAMQPVTF